MHFFYLPGLQETGVTAFLRGEEARHAYKVLRLKPGDKISLLNGVGSIFEGVVAQTTAEECEVLITQKTGPILRPYRLLLAIASIKKTERLEWLIEKAVELGADEVIVFTSERTEKTGFKDDRLKKIALAAMKQSGNPWLPQIITGETLKNLTRIDFDGGKFIAHCEEKDQPHLKNIYHKGKSALILIGPEGDFTKEEISQAVAHGFVPVGLGPLRLRAETAALAALYTIQLQNV